MGACEVVLLIRIGGEISRHVDADASHYVHKIHVPLITNTESIFHVGKQLKNLPVCEVIEVNKQRGDHL